MTITIEKFRKYENKWVAINEKKGTIIASGDSIIVVQKKAAKTKEKNVTLKFIYPFNSYFAP